MLSGDYFYYKLTRKYVALFGNMFNNITLLRRNVDDGTEIERFKIPIAYGPKEKYMVRPPSDPDLNRGIQSILPRMSYELTSITYASDRKQNTLLRDSKSNNSTRVASSYMSVPYNLTFELNILTRNIDDGLHIVEQILPYFNPHYTVTVDTIPELSVLKDIPLILTGVSNTVEYEGSFDATRIITWRLEFIMKVAYIGPIQTPKIIRKVITNIYNDPSLVTGYVIRINTDSGNSGTYKIDDTVYVGPDYQTATAYGKVLNWNANTGKLVIGGTQGNFTANSRIRALSTNASFNIASFDTTPLKLAKIVIDPNPLSAEPTDDYGYTTTITEFPNIT